MGTSPENWDQIKSLFEAAIELNPSHRSAYVERNASDSGVREEVIRLLAEHDHAGGFLSNPAFADMRSLQAQGAGQLAPGDLLDGKFKITSLIAEGGMGQVWLAEQTIPLQRQVVVKLIRAGIYDEAASQRFRAERQSLALMDHPCIAKVFDAGATPAGQPYFVMEYVPGVAITVYCDEKKLNTRQRLELFVKVCEGVQHAHQKAIIHRDLKPANILVVEVDGIPTPRIIDFGIAKATSPFAAQPEYTQGAGFVGTPGFMSPEQADPRVADVDTRADVYSLGAVLYILLAGSPPFDAKRWKKAPLDEMLRHLREDDPPRPSTKVSEVRETSAAIAEARGTDIKRLVSSLRGDLDWITMKALDKDRARRYSTPLELAMDIRRYLTNEPIVARPAATGYRLGKYVRRHRIGVAVTAAVFLLLVGFSALQAAQLRRTTRERDRANRITNFMTRMFKVSNPSEARGNSITAREILDKASKDVESALVKDPELQAQMMMTMGSVYLNLGLYPRAESLSKQAVDIRRRVLGPEDPATLSAQQSLGDILEHEGRYPDAEKLDRDTLDVRRRTLGPAHLDTLESLNNLAIVLDDEGHHPEAEKLWRDVLDARIRVLGRENSDTANAINNVARAVDRQGHYAEAEKLHREALEIRRRVLGPDHPFTLDSLNNLAVSLAEQAKFAEGEKLFREALDIRRRILGPEHPNTLMSIDNLSVILNAQNHYAESEKLERQDLDIRQRVLGPEHPDTLNSINNLADILDNEGHYAESEKLLRESVEIKRRVLGPEHPDTLTTLNNLAGSFLSQGRYGEAEKLERQVLAARQRVLGPTHPDTALAWFSLASIAAKTGRRDEALSLLNAAVDNGLAPPYDLLIGEDSHLTSLHGDPRFTALVAHAKELAAATQQHN